jgi:glycosyltransferase involved in cell wall biosynthesis
LKTDGSQYKVSIIICCYNSELRIKNTIQNLLFFDDRDDFEVVFVDNKSTDGTAELISSRCFGKLNYMLVTEHRQGLAHARKTGVLNASGEIIIFCDDDNWPDKDYLERVWEIFQDNQKIGALGGQSEAAMDMEEPGWFKNHMQSYAVGIQNHNSGDVTDRRYLWGACIAIRRDILLALYENGFTPLCTGRKGNEILAGDDSEICRLIILLGWRLWYDERLKFKHYIPKERLTLNYLENLYIGFNKSDHFLGKYDKVIDYYQFGTSITKKIRDTLTLLYKALLFQITFKDALQQIQIMYPKNPFFRIDKDITMINSVYLKSKSLK